MTESFDALMNKGHEAVASGQPEAALEPWTRALELAPESLDARLNLATLLSHLRQPQQAYQLLAAAQAELWAQAQGCCNLAIAAEDAGQLEMALKAYHRTLELDPDNVRALANLSALAARSRQWEGAVSLARRAVQKAPEDVGLWINLCDFLTGAGDEDGAADCADAALARHPGVQAVALRRVVALALCARLDEAAEALQSLGPQAPRALDAWLRGRRGEAAPHHDGPWVPLDLRELYLTHVFERMRVADWRHTDQATAVVRELVNRFHETQAPRDWRDLQFHALQLPLDENLHRSLWAATALTLNDRVQPVTTPPLQPRTDARGPIRIGFLVPALHDPRQIDHLLQWLQRINPQRFERFAYLAQPVAAFPGTAALERMGCRVVAIDHFTAAEAVQRIRLDALDVMVDTTFYTPTCRPEILFSRVAPVQIRHQNWQRHQASVDGLVRIGSCAYSVGDHVTHPGTTDEVQRQFGAIARWPGTCWLAMPPSLPLPMRSDDEGRRATRRRLGLPESAAVLVLWLPALYLDRDTFRLACSAAAAHPNAVLWLPPYGPDARRHLSGAAQALGLDAQRLHFMAGGDRLQQVADLACADLFLDSVRFSATGSVADALFMGVPVVAVCGTHMAARLGASVVQAAGLGELVAPDLDTATRLLGSLLAAPDRLVALRAQLIAHREGRLSPLFDPDARVREWEAAWQHMVAQHRAGLPAGSFDVPQAEPAP